MRIKKCECGAEKSNDWNDLCDKCSDKKHYKDIVLLVVGVFLSIVVISLFVAVIIEYQTHINAFFYKIEISVTDVYNNLSNFLQNFIKALSACLLIVTGLFFMGFVLYSASRDY